MDEPLVCGDDLLNKTKVAKRRLLMRAATSRIRLSLSNELLGRMNRLPVASKAVRVILRLNAPTQRGGVQRRARR